MSGYQPMDLVRPRMSSGVPPVPVVPRDRIWPGRDVVIDLPRFIDLRRRARSQRETRERLERMEPDSAWHRSMPPAVRDIIVAVCKQHDVSPSHAIGPSRVHGLIPARYEIYYALYLTGRFSLTQVGRYLGRHHTTVLNGIRCHAQVTGLPMPDMASYRVKRARKP